MVSSLPSLLDDIATVLDDISILAQVAAKKTAGGRADALAREAGRISGVRAARVPRPGQHDGHDSYGDQCKMRPGS